MKTLKFAVLIGGCATYFWLGNVGLARPSYKKVFESTYAQEFADVAEAKRCTVCHQDSDKKSLRNNYGDAIAKTLNQKNESDADRFRATLRDVELLPSAIEGKTFGDLIKEHRLPASR